MRNDIHTVTTQKHQDIFMGTSHGKMNIDPKTISSVTGRTGHNLCVGGEYGIDAYYLAKLLFEKQKPERIIYEVDPGYFATQKEAMTEAAVSESDSPKEANRVADIDMDREECELPDIESCEQLQVPLVAPASLLRNNQERSDLSTINHVSHRAVDPIVKLKKQSSKKVRRKR